MENREKENSPVLRFYQAHKISTPDYTHHEDKEIKDPIRLDALDAAVSSGK